MWGPGPRPPNGVGPAWDHASAQVPMKREVEALPTWLVDPSSQACSFGSGQASMQQTSYNGRPSLPSPMPDRHAASLCGGIYNAIGAGHPAKTAYENSNEESLFAESLFTLPSDLLRSLAGEEDEDQESGGEEEEAADPTLTPEERHIMGTCRPCSYFHFKEDGCRNGDSCEFCHLCTTEEARRKKQANKRIARNARERKQRRPQKEKPTQQGVAQLPSRQPQADNYSAKMSSPVSMPIPVKLTSSPVPLRLPGPHFSHARSAQI